MSAPGRRLQVCVSNSSSLRGQHAGQVTFRKAKSSGSGSSMPSRYGAQLPNQQGMALQGRASGCIAQSWCEPSFFLSTLSLLSFALSLQPKAKTQTKSGVLHVSTAAVTRPGGLWMVSFWLHAYPGGAIHWLMSSAPGIPEASPC